MTNEQISMTVKEFAHAVGTVAHAASLDTTRTHLNAVHFRAKDGRLTIEATDGHWAARWQCKATEETGLDVDVTLRLDFVMELLRFARRYVLPTMVIDVAAKTVTIAPFVTFSWAPEFEASSEFPRLDQVIPPPRMPTCGAIGVGPMLLIKVARAMHYAYKGNGYKAEPSMFVELGGAPTDPIVITSSDVPELTIVAMPMRCSAAAHRTFEPELPAILTEGHTIEEPANEMQAAQ